LFVATSYKAYISADLQFFKEVNKSYKSIRIGVLLYQFWKHLIDSILCRAPPNIWLRLRLEQINYSLAFFQLITTILYKDFHLLFYQNESSCKSFRGLLFPCLRALIYRRFARVNNLFFLFSFCLWPCWYITDIVYLWSLVKCFFHTTQNYKKYLPNALSNQKKKECFFVLHPRVESAFYN